MSQIEERKTWNRSSAWTPEEIAMINAQTYKAVDEALSMAQQFPNSAITLTDEQFALLKESIHDGIRDGLREGIAKILK